MATPERSTTPGPVSPRKPRLRDRVFGAALCLVGIATFGLSLWLFGTAAWGEPDHLWEVQRARGKHELDPARHQHLLNREVEALRISDAMLEMDVKSKLTRYRWWQAGYGAIALLLGLTAAAKGALLFVGGDEAQPAEPDAAPDLSSDF